MLMYLVTTLIVVAMVYAFSVTFEKLFAEYIATKYNIGKFVRKLISYTSSIVVTSVILYLIYEVF